MTIEQFIEISGKTPEQLHDDSSRTIALLDAGDLLVKREWRLPDVSSVELLFSGTPPSRLYQIAYTLSMKDFESVTKEFTALYGPPRKSFGQFRPGGSEQLLEWLNGAHRLIVSYFMMESGIHKLSYVLIANDSFRWNSNN